MRYRPNVLLVALSVTALVACEGGLPSGGGPEVSLFVGGVTIAGDGSYTYQFGDVAVGASASASFTIRNDGSGPLEFTGGSPVVVTGAGAGAFSLAAGPEASVSAGGETTFVLTFAPTTAGAATASVALESAAAAGVVHRFSVSGTGVPTTPDIEVAVGSEAVPGDGSHTHAFGSVAVGQSASIGFVIRNVGTAALGLTGTPLVAVSGAGLASFVVSAQPAAASIQAGGELAFTIAFAPVAEGAAAATVTIASDDPDASAYAFGVSGTGTAPAAGSLQVRLRSAPAGAEGKTLFGLAWPAPGVFPMYFASATVAGGQADLTFSEPETQSTSIPGGTALEVRVFVDMNGEGPVFAGSGLEWPDYGDLVPAWPSSGLPEREVTIAGDTALDLTGDDFSVWTERLLYFNLTNGAEVQDLDGKVVYASVHLPGEFPLNPVASGSVDLSSASLAAGQQLLLYRASDQLPYSLDAAEQGTSLALSIVVDMDASHIEGDAGSTITAGDYRLWWPTFTPSMLDLPGSDDLLLDLGIGTGIEYFIQPQ